MNPKVTLITPQQSAVSSNPPVLTAKYSDYYEESNQSNFQSGTLTDVVAGSSGLSLSGGSGVVGFPGLLFDGSSTYSKATTTSYSINIFTVELLVQYTGTNQMTIVDYENGSAYYGWKVWQSSATPGKIRFKLADSVGGAIAEAISSTSVNDGKVHRISCVDDNVNLKIYIDGVLDVTATSGTKQYTGTMYSYWGAIRPENASKGEWYSGKLADVRIWNTARTQTEIDANKFKHLNGNESGLISYWPTHEMVNNPSNVTVNQIDMTLSAGLVWTGLGEKNYAQSSNGGSIQASSLNGVGEYPYVNVINGTKGVTANTSGQYGGLSSGVSTKIGQWFTIKTATPIACSHIDWWNDGVQGATSMEVRVSNDNFVGDNRLVGNFSALSSGTTATRNVWSFPEVNAQYFRFTYKAVADSTYVQIQEVEIFAVDPTTAVPGTVLADLASCMTGNSTPYNAAQGQVVSADFSSTPTYNPYNAFDRNPGTSWYTSDTSAFHWLKYDFGAGNAKVVTKIGLSGFYVSSGPPQVYSVTGWTLYGSNDNTNFTQIGTGTHANNAGREVYDISNTTAYRYYRINPVSSHYTSTKITGIRALELMTSSTGTGGYKTSGKRTSAPISLSGVANDYRISWTATTPAGTSVSVKVALNNNSLLMPSDASFQSATSGQLIPGIMNGDNLDGQFLWIREELTGNGTVSPTLTNLTTTIPANNYTAIVNFEVDTVSTFNSSNKQTGSVGPTNNNTSVSWTAPYANIGTYYWRARATINDGSNTVTSYTSTQSYQISQMEMSFNSDTARGVREQYIDFSGSGSGDSQGTSSGAIEIKDIGVYFSGSARDNTSTASASLYIPSQVATVKVKNGITRVSGDSQTVTVDLGESFLIDKSFVIIDRVAESVSTFWVRSYAYLSGSNNIATQLVIKTPAHGSIADVGAGVGDIHWKIIQHPSFKVQQGYTSLGGNNSINIAPVDLTKAFAILHGGWSDSWREYNNMATIGFNSNSQIGISYLQGSNGGDGGGYWYVVEWTGATVQSGTTDLNGSLTSRTVTISTVDPNSSFVLFTYSPNIANDYLSAHDNRVRGFIKNSTTIEFDRYSYTSGSGGLSIKWFVISNPGIGTQHFQGVLNDPALTATISMNPVDTKNTFTVGSRMVSNSGPPSSGDTLGFDITNSTTLTVVRKGSKDENSASANATFNVSAIQLGYSFGYDTSRPLKVDPYTISSDISRQLNWKTTLTGSISITLDGVLEVKYRRTLKRPYILYQVEPFVHLQLEDADQVIVYHEKGKLNPVVVLMDEAGNIFEGYWRSLDPQNVIIRLNKPMKFTAYIY